MLSDWDRRAYQSEHSHSTGRPVDKKTSILSRTSRLSLDPPARMGVSYLAITWRPRLFRYTMYPVSRIRGGVDSRPDTRLGGSATTPGSATDAEL